MREYGTINTAFYTKRQARAIGLEASALYAYLCANPHGHTIGCYQIPVGYIAADLGINIDKASNLLKILIEHQLINYDYHYEYVLMYEGSKHKLVPNQSAAKGWQPYITSIPKELSFYDVFIARLMPYAALFEPGVLPSVDTGVDTNNNNHNNNHEREEQGATESAAPLTHDDTFQEFWENYPAHRRTKQKQTKKAWKQATKETPPESIVAKLKLYLASSNAQDENGKFIPNPDKWLKEEWYQRNDSAPLIPHHTPTEEEQKRRYHVYKHMLKNSGTTSPTAKNFVEQYEKNL